MSLGTDWEGGEESGTPLHTNSIESSWNLYKRAQKGTYTHNAPKHTDRYIAEPRSRLGLAANLRFGDLEDFASGFLEDLGLRFHPWILGFLGLATLRTFRKRIPGVDGYGWA